LQIFPSTTENWTEKAKGQDEEAKEGQEKTRPENEAQNLDRKQK